ncbi:glyoxalase II family member [Actinoplanes sp. ATCC 53533]|uniref:MBL fold metallo-hydrolase n=1 Tax=Actinoplanes sp. ATCC 53533 TaxID=1288362 RepID=UPI000F7AF59A|nr:MBL fold metallo-hydrolase [Actinoplanes sp. ATCC 53533]RSM71814.1 glyoxalase II family member [Actinoplanes sp. ATCC 53533]
MRDLRLTRRHLLVTAGSGILGVTVLNTVTGCSKSTGPATPASPDAARTASAGATGTAAGDWQRVNLSFVSAYLLIRGDEAAVVDLGTDGSADSIGSALTAAGSGWGAVRHVLLTHQHPDHAGGLAGVAPQVKAAIYAGEADVAGITSAQPLQPVKDGDEIFGLRIIGTPGHTAGHISVFDPSTGVLVAGDALRTTAGLVGPDPKYTADTAQAAASVRKLAALGVKTILPGHGEPLTSGAGDALSKLAASIKG